MHINHFLPSWDISKTNEIALDRVNTIDTSFLFQINFGESMIIRLLFLLRGMPGRMLSLQGIINAGFILLEEDRKEIVIGLIAQPWKLDGNILRMSPIEFKDFVEPDFVKVVWNFYIDELDKDRLNISTETRIHCTSSKARRRFSFYWFIIGYFSGLIRKEMLKLIKNKIINTGDAYSMKS